MRKKTRFVTEKGIREAGRDSLGGELSGKPKVVPPAFSASASTSGARAGVGARGTTRINRARGRMVVVNDYEVDDDDDDDDDDDELVILR